MFNYGKINNRWTLLLKFDDLKQKNKKQKIRKITKQKNPPYL